MTYTLQFAANRRLYLFGLWLALVTACGLTLPPTDVRLSLSQTLLVLLSGIATAALGVALAGYLVESWKLCREACAPYEQRLSLSIETLIAVPILLLCLMVPAVGAVEALINL